MNGLPEGWKIVNLEDVVEIIMGQSPPSNTYNTNKIGLPFFQGKAEFGKMHPEIKIFCSVPQKTAKKNDILMSVRAPVGSLNIANTECCIGRGLCAIRTSDKLDFIYLYYFLKKIEKSISSMGVGSTFTAINKKDIQGLQITLPPLPTQKKIAAVLEKAEKLREWRKEADGLTDRFLKSTFLEMFGDPASNPKGWIVSNLGNELSDDTQNGLYKPETDYGNGVPILRIDSFYDGQISNIEKLKRLKCTKEEIEKFKLQIGDILINRVNSIEYLGKCGRVKFLNEDTVYESNMMRIRPKPEKLNSTFLTMLLCTQYIKNQILGCAKKAVNQASINQKDVNSFKILVPPLSLQQKFASVVQQVEQVREHQTQSRQHIENFFNVLMQKAFSGELGAK